MKKVINPNYSKCSNILYRDSPSFSGIAAGECEGDVWVDDLENPSLALVYSYAVGGFSIMGSPSDVSVYDDFIEFLRRELFAYLKSKGINYFEFSMESKRAEAYILQRFADEKINQENEYFYRRYNAYEIQDIDNYNIVPVDSEFIKHLQAGRYDNPNFLRKRLLKSWGSYENFFGESTAYAATLDTSIIAVIVGTARYQGVIPIDIETKKEYRKKGLAFMLTRYFVNECVSRGLIAQWNCVESNTASKNTAEKAGFKLIKKKPYYWFDI